MTDGYTRFADERAKHELSELQRAFKDEGIRKWCDAEIEKTTRNLCLSSPESEQQRYLLTKLTVLRQLRHDATHESVGEQLRRKRDE